MRKPAGFGILHDSALSTWVFVVHMFVADHPHATPIRVPGGARGDSALVSARGSSSGTVFGGVGGGVTSGGETTGDAEDPKSPEALGLLPLYVQGVWSGGPSGLLHMLICVGWLCSDAAL